MERDDISRAITLPIVGRPANDAGSHWCLWPLKVRYKEISFVTAKNGLKEMQLHVVKDFLTHIHISTLHFKIPLLYWPTEKWEDQIAPLLLKLSESLVVFSDFADVSALAVVEWCYIFPP